MGRFGEYFGDRTQALVDWFGGMWEKGKVCRVLVWVVSFTGGLGRKIPFFFFLNGVEVTNGNLATRLWTAKYEVFVGT